MRGETSQKNFEESNRGDPGAFLVDESTGSIQILAILAEDSMKSSDRVVDTKVKGAAHQTKLQNVQDQSQDQDLKGITRMD